MLAAKYLIASFLAVGSAGAIADSGDLDINDWSTVSFNITRAEVLAQLREATRLGLVSEGEADIPIATNEQEHLIAESGRDAAQKFAKGNAEFEG